MDRLSITTHLIAIITAFSAFSAFTMPIAIEVLNRVKNRYGSAYYMDSIEHIMGFKVHYLFRELVVTLIALILFSILVSSVNELSLSNRWILFFELLFALVTSVLLIKEFLFIKTVFQATRSDSLVTNHLINKLTIPDTNDSNHAQEVELLIQITCYNIENTTTLTEESIENRLFRIIEESYENQKSLINDNTIKNLLDGLAVALTSARNANNRGAYVALQRNYAEHLILFFDRKIKNYDVFEKYSQEFYEESIKELGSGNYWLMRADFLISVNMWDIQNPQTINFIDRIIRNLIDFAVREKPSLVPSILERYRSFVGYDSYFCSDLHNLLTIFGSYNSDYYEEIQSLIEEHEEKIISAPEAYMDKFILLVKKSTYEALKHSTSIEQYEKIKTTALEYKQEMITEIMKSKGSIASRNTAQYAIRALAKDNLWGDMVECFESFSPASSKVIRMGFNILPCSLSSIIEQLGKTHGFSPIHSEEFDLSYQRATPILVMYVLYCWRIKNPKKKLRDGVNQMTVSLRLGERTIRNVKKIQSTMHHVQYFSKSFDHSQTFCRHFNINHEVKDFHKATILIFDEIEKYLGTQLKDIIATQPLSDDKKNRYMDSVAAYPENGLRRMPLLDCVSLTSSKQDPILYSMRPEGRAVFLDNNDVSYSFNGRGVIEKIHNDLAIKKITKNGNPLEELKLSDCNENKILIITNKDWEVWSSEKSRTDLNRVNKHLVFTGTALGSYFTYDTKALLPLATLYSPTGKGKGSLLEHLRNAFEFDFRDENGKVAIQAKAHVYY
ncbi:hypothetical protein [Aliivibrio logei]|uniref:Uncharacterized protein n=1 Tax=Aliivibrio logei 5S-186 TaxID=626086 RepID=A0ABX3AXM3_ALILO|nr:hypothetical protein [Aliivibrio logei]OEF19475.1 hypothetical protein A1Q5_17835 [Aliivibrio logei 5S-186]